MCIVQCACYCRIYNSLQKSIGWEQVFKYHHVMRSFVHQYFQKVRKNRSLLWTPGEGGSDRGVPPHVGKVVVGQRLQLRSLHSAHRGGLIDKLLETIIWGRIQELFFLIISFNESSYTEPDFIPTVFLRVSFILKRLNPFFINFSMCASQAHAENHISLQYYMTIFSCPLLLPRSYLLLELWYSGCLPLLTTLLLTTWSCCGPSYSFIIAVAIISADATTVVVVVAGLPAVIDLCVDVGVH